MVNLADATITVGVALLAAVGVLLAILAFFVTRRYLLKLATRIIRRGDATEPARTDFRIKSALDLRAAELARAQPVFCGNRQPAGVRLHLG